MRFVLRLLSLAVVIGIQRPSVAQEVHNADTTLMNAIAAWKLTRSETKRVHLKTRGTVTRLKGSEVIEDPYGKQPPKEFPSKDIAYETQDEFFIDFENGKYRHDWRTYALVHPSEKLNPIVKIDILDVIERKIYSANPERAFGRLASDVSLKAKDVQDSDVIKIGLEPTMFCFGYLKRSLDDRKGWDRDPSPQDFVVISASPLRLRQIAGSLTNKMYVELTFLNDQRFKIAQMRWVSNDVTIWDLHVEYNSETGCPSSWQSTSYNGDRVANRQIHEVNECAMNEVIPPGVFGIEVKPDMALKTDDGFFRVQPDGKSLTPITPITPLEVARGLNDESSSWFLPSLLLLGGTAIVVIGVWWKCNKG